MTEKLENTLTVNGYRRLVTIQVNNQLIDVSFCVASYQNCINEMPGCARTIEIRPRDNQIIGRALLLQIKKELEEAFPQLQSAITNANIYEIGMVDTYDKYRKGYIVSEAAEEFERLHPESTKKLDNIVEDLIQTRNMTYVMKTPSVEELRKKQDRRVPEEEEL